MQRITFQVGRKPLGLWQRILAFITALGILALAIFLGFFALLFVLGLFVIGGIYFAFLRFRARHRMQQGHPSQEQAKAAQDNGTIEASYTIIKRRRN